MTGISPPMRGIKEAIDDVTTTFFMLGTLAASLRTARVPFTVPDLAQEAALRGKLDGVDYILHLASPLAQGTDKEPLGTPMRGIKEAIDDVTTTFFMLGTLAASLRTASHHPRSRPGGCSQRQA
jgi:hypothetical protein